MYDTNNMADLIVSHNPHGLTATVEVEDAVAGHSRTTPISVDIGILGLGVHFPGYGDFSSMDDNGEPVLIEYRDGVPYVVVWADINSQEPTHVISLANAALKNRKETE
jgi:hypothetical protein